MANGLKADVIRRLDGLKRMTSDDFHFTAREFSWYRIFRQAGQHSQDMKLKMAQRFVSVSTSNLFLFLNHVGSRYLTATESDEMRHLGYHWL